MKEAILQQIHVVIKQGYSLVQMVETETINKLQRDFDVFIGDNDRIDVLR